LKRTGAGSVTSISRKQKAAGILVGQRSEGAKGKRPADRIQSDLRTSRRRLQWAEECYKWGPAKMGQMGDRISHQEKTKKKSREQGGEASRLRKKRYRAERAVHVLERSADVITMKGAGDPIARKERTERRIPQQEKRALYLSDWTGQGKCTRPRQGRRVGEQKVRETPIWKGFYAGALPANGEKRRIDAKVKGFESTPIGGKLVPEGRRRLPRSIEKGRSSFARRKVRRESIVNPALQKTTIAPSSG